MFGRKKDPNIRTVQGYPGKGKVYAMLREGWEIHPEIPPSPVLFSGTTTGQYKFTLRRKEPSLHEESST